MAKAWPSVDTCRYLDYLQFIQFRGDPSSHAQTLFLAHSAVCTDLCYAEAATSILTVCFRTTLKLSSKLPKHALEIRHSLHPPAHVGSPFFDTAPSSDGTRVSRLLDPL